MLIIWFLFVGAIAGWLAGLIVKGRGFGLLGDIGVGIIGAFIGGFFFRSYGTFSAILVALFGAVLFLVVVKLIRKI